MKNSLKIVFFLLFSSFIMVSCDGLLNVDSDRYVMDDEYRMKSMNDSLYGMFGVFSQLQKVADEYVLLGELRGDLMTTTSRSNPDLEEINNFKISATNQFNDTKQYYAVINNCNYIIKYTDTTTTYKNEKVMYKVVAAAKAIRAWTYMQLCFNYKTVKYYTEPVLTTEFDNSKITEMNFDALSDALISDLSPYRDVQKLNYIGDVNSINFSECLFPVRVLLGDLYLWKGQYEKAATEYHDYLLIEKKLIASGYASTIDIANNVFIKTNKTNWKNCFEPKTSENVASIGASNEKGPVFLTDSLARDYQLTASNVALNNWYSQHYVELSNGVSLDTMLDMRIINSVVANYKLSATSFDYSLPAFDSKNYISKLIYMNRPANVSKKIMPYRVSTVYLRYAEAVNRLGKPHLAFAVLKNGLSPATLANRLLVPSSEVPDTLQASMQYMNFTNSVFTNNIGIRSRGLGRAQYDQSYVIPDTLSTEKMIEFVEDKIIDEYALETAFEGNRFHDLMRVALRRNNPNYLAKKVAAKYSNKAEMETLLNNTENWYLKK